MENLSKEELIRLIKIKDAFCKMIIALGFDYDGLEKPESLKGLIDELVRYADMAIKNDDKTCMYISGFENKECNILGEEI